MQGHGHDEHAARVAVPHERRPIQLILFMKTKSLSNEHAHWRVRQRRAKEQRERTAWAWVAVGGKPLRDGEAATVHLTRVAPRMLDSDNLPPSMKSIRDEVAKQLGLDDRTPRITWVYDQRKGQGQYSVEVYVTFREETA